MRTFGRRASFSIGVFIFNLLPATLEAAQLQCVQYARVVTNVPLQGDAWTWWSKAARAGLARGQAPESGSILVFRKTARLGRGHVAVVGRVAGAREIVVDHANWASRPPRGQIATGVRVVDVSPANDWSEVRVWHAPSASLGQRVYPTYGFIFVRSARASPRYAVAVPRAAS